MGMTSRPIEDYALIGNRHTVTLVALDETVDWLCCTCLRRIGNLPVRF